MAVIGEDSARQDRRYTYKACDDLGGFCFENCKAVRGPGMKGGGWEGARDSLVSWWVLGLGVKPFSSHLQAWGGACLCSAI